MKFKNSNFLTIFLFAIVEISTVNSDNQNDGLFTSNIDLQDVLRTENELVRYLEDYIKQEEKKIEKLRQHVSDFENIRERAQLSPDFETFVGNPLNSYQLIKTMTSDWKEVVETINSNQGEAFLKYLSDMNNKTH